MKSMFSARTGWSRAPSRLAELSGRGVSLLDLTESNPTRAGFESTELVALLGDARGVRYRPEPRGTASAREAVSRYYEERGHSVDPDSVVLCASTSEGYGWLFKLLCDPGDALLVPSPAYPLLPYLADLDAVRLIDYPLLREERFRIDLAAVASSLESSRARGVVVVHPGNPSGHFTRRDEARELGAMARAGHAALIVDEVFADYAHGELGADRLASFVGGTDALTFVMSGLSKVALAPQLKLGWIVVAGGDEAMRREAVERLEIVADSYLSVSTAVQLALPEILHASAPIQRRARARVATNLAALDRVLREGGAECPVSRLPLDGGWYASLQLPRTRPDDEWLAATIEAGVLVHPGYVYDMPGSGVMVVSLLSDEVVFAEGIERCVELWSRA